MPSEIEGEIYYSLFEASRQIGVPMEIILAWLSGRAPLRGLTLETVRDAESNQYFLKEDAVRILQHKNHFVSLPPLLP